MKISAGKIQFFELKVADFFSKAGREHLPWRKKKITAYEVWVSEIMLQQTQVSRVIDYYVRFLKRYPTVRSLAKSDWAEFLPYYEGLGYYARGRNMLKASKMVVADFNGQFPRERKLLETIPGIGPYTASAILSFAYGENHLAWDTNLKRVIGRFFYGTKRADFDTPAFEARLSLPAKTLNAALMDFGSALCLARPKCEACPLMKKCQYYGEKGIGELRMANLPETLRVSKRVGDELKKKKEIRADWRGALAAVFLHENHRKYFSAGEKKYDPFLLPKGYNSRAGIKDWFLRRYGLRLSVRPPHQKLVLKGRPILLVNAQILSGNHLFPVFFKKDYRAYMAHLVKSI